MFAYVYDTASRDVLKVIPNVKEVGYDYVKGDIHLEGLPPSASVIVTDSIYNENDVIPINETNKVSEYKSQEVIISELKLENQNLREQLSQTNTDLTQFMDFYFSNL